MAAAGTIRVEVACALPGGQFLRALDLPAGSTVDEAIAAAGVAVALGEGVLALEAGIWSRPVPRTTPLRDGDRVELYRPLTVDPKEARRRRAAKRD